MVCIITTGGCANGQDDTISSADSHYRPVGSHPASLLSQVFNLSFASRYSSQASQWSLFCHCRLSDGLCQHQVPIVQFESQQCPVPFESVQQRNEFADPWFAIHGDVRQPRVHAFSPSGWGNSYRSCCRASSNPVDTARRSSSKTLNWTLFYPPISIRYERAISKFTPADYDPLFTHSAAN